MFPWTKLPNELRHEVVKRMDFISRFRFRGVSKTEQQLVDSTPLYMPRVAFRAVKDDRVALTFYLGIEKGVTVIFDKKQDGVIEVTRFLDMDSKGKTRRLTNTNLYQLSAQVLASVAMNPNTILGGFEFMFDVMSFETSCLIEKSFGTKSLRCRTKVLTVENGCWAFILARCSFPDLLEVQIIGDPVKQENNRLRMVCFSKREEVRIAGESRNQYWIRNYVPFEEKNIEQLAKAKGKFRHMLRNSEVEKVAPNHYKFYKKEHPGFFKIELTSCGVNSQFMQEKMERKTPKSCGMRWACAKHADPFEHWYYPTIIKPTLYNNLDFDLIKVSGKQVFCEIVHPIVNGRSTLDLMFKATYERFVQSPRSSMSCGNFKKRKGMYAEVEGEYETVPIRPLGTNGPSIHMVKTEGSEPKMVETEAELTRLLIENMVAKGSLVLMGEDGSELTGEEAQKELKKWNAQELKSEVGAGRVQKELKVSEGPKESEGSQPEVVESSDVSDKRGSAGEEVAAGKEESEVSEIPKVSDDSEAEEDNPFDTEEFKSKFNKQQSNPKSDKSLFILAVLSAIFGFFFMFFFH